MAFVTALVAAALSAAPASAIIVKLPHGGYANYDAITGAKAPHAARIFDAAFTNLDYSGGAVMPSNTNYVVEWNPSNYPGSDPGFQAGNTGQLDYVPGVSQFFQDMAHDSATTGNSDAVSTQYNDATGATAAYNSSYGGLLIDTNPLPANGCPTTSPGDICITDAQIQTELDTFLAAHGVPHDLAHEYYLLTPPSVASCFDAAGTSCSANADQNTQFCAYHSETSTGGYVYSNIPDLTGVNGCDPFVTNSFSCPSFSCSYNNGPADGVLSAISHEHNESITDPQPNNAWTDWGSSVGGEIGDKCNNDAFNDPNLNFGGAAGDAPYNETVNGTHYLIQREWSNQTTSCLDSFTPSATTAAASYSSSPGSGNTVNFDASTSTSSPGGVAEYVWQFNDGPGQTTTQESTSPTMTHTFPSAGAYLVALTVMNADGTSNGAAQTISAGVGGGTPPTAAFTDSAPALEGTAVSFNSSGSSDPNPGGTLSYAWNFGDGGTSTAANPSHTYSHFGPYTVTLTVTDSATGLTGSTPQSVTITDEAPVAAFGFTPASPTAGSSVSFNGTGSGDSDGHVASWSWNYGDGSAAGAGSTSSHSYAHPGSYMATLTITDSNGQNASVNHTVVVASGSAPPPTYLPPTAQFASGSGQEGVPVTLSGSGSTDPNAGGSLSYAWSFGDGATAVGTTVAHAFHAGSWNVTLTVTDSPSGLSGSVSHVVTITDEGPSATFTAPTGLAGQTLSFTGSGSDPDGAIAAYSWSFGDGDTAAGAGPTHAYAGRGVYTATLTIVDTSGQLATISHVVMVGARPAVCVVPRLKGMSLRQAKQALKAAHCALGKTKTPRAPRKKAGKGKHWELIVAKQTPAPGTTEHTGSRVALKLAYKAVRN